MSEQDSKTKTDKYHLINTLKEAYKMIYASWSKKYLFAFLIISLVIAIFTPMLSIIQKNIINKAMTLFASNSNKMVFDILTVFFLYFVVQLTLIVLGFLVEYISISGNKKTIDKSLKDLLGKYCRIEFFNYDNPEYLNDMHWSTAEVPQRVKMILFDSLNIVTQLATLASVMFILARQNWVVTVIVLIGTIPTIILFQKQTQDQFTNDLRNCSELRYQWYCYSINLKRETVKEVKFNMLLGHIMGNWQKTVNMLWDRKRRIFVKYTSLQFGGKVIMYLMVIISLLIITGKIIEKKLTIGDFILFLGLVQSMQLALILISSSIIRISDSGKYIGIWRNVLNTTEESLLKPDLDFKCEEIISIENVKFAYHGSSYNALDGVSLNIKNGEKIAIVGENGSGKTTLVSLISGLYKPAEGNIKICEVNIDKCLGTLREKLSCALQKFVKYEMSIEDNIKIGNFPDTVSDEKLDEIIKKVGLYEDICKLPDGVKTHLGTLEEKGENFSGGQWQKIVLARALARENANIYIMDEPTAALDPISEAKLYKEFKNLTADKTLILISHRLGATQIADRIIVMDKGKIVEEGTHKNLIYQNGLYAKMYRSQAQWYA